MTIEQRLRAALQPLPATERAAQRGVLDALRDRPKRAAGSDHLDYLLGYYAGVVARESRDCAICNRRFYPAAHVCPDCLDVAWTMAS